jgi:dCMP deaminase
MDSIMSVSNQTKPSPVVPECLKPFNLHGWTRNIDLSNDENYMDIVLLITRSSHKKGGSMGCIIVNDPCGKSDEEFYNSIMAASTNKSLYKENDSDIHAEVSTIGQCAEQGLSTRNGTIYITMPPCKKCFGAIVSAGIKRVVSNKKYQDQIQNSAKRHGIELVSMDHLLEGQKMRLNDLINVSNGQRKRSQQDSCSSHDEKRSKIQ